MGFGGVAEEERIRREAEGGEEDLGPFADRGRVGDDGDQYGAGGTFGSGENFGHGTEVEGAERGARERLGELAGVAGADPEGGIGGRRGGDAGVVNRDLQGFSEFGGEDAGEFGVRVDDEEWGGRGGDAVEGVAEIGEGMAVGLRRDEPFADKGIDGGLGFDEDAAAAFGFDPTAMGETAVDGADSVGVDFEAASEFAEAGEFPAGRQGAAEDAEEELGAELGGDGGGDVAGDPEFHRLPRMIPAGGIVGKRVGIPGRAFVCGESGMQ